MKTEKEMREEKVPRLKDINELIKYIDELVDREHDYGTCVYAMSMAATAAFNYVASKLGVSGFQASCGDLDIIRRTRNMEIFKIINYEDMLYPQSEYRFDKIISPEIAKWLKDEATKKLSESRLAHPDVSEHWKRLAAGFPPFGFTVKAD